VPIKLLLEIGLGVDCSAQRAHRDLKFPAAKCADCDDRGRAKPFDDSKIALFRRLVHLNHRTCEFGVSRNAFNLGSSSTFFGLSF
jgi:hypothetical protein